MREEHSLIHGLELQGRALTAVTGDSDNVAFLVGTQSLRHTNMLYKVIMDEENNQLAKRAYKHSLGEVWHIDSCPDNPSLFTSTFGEKSGVGGWRKRAALMALPEDVGDSEEDQVEVEVRTEMDTVVEGGGEVSSTTFQPNDSSKVVCLVGDRAVMADIGEEEVKKLYTVTHSVRGQTRIETGRFNPHRNCHQYATACGSQVIGWDSRTGEQGWIITNTTQQGNIRTMDFNPNKQYYLCTGGDDGMVSIWDTRNPTEPLYSHRQHSHWVWGVRYNTFHDQLLLSAGSDSRVVLSSMASLSSEPYGSLVEQEEEQQDGETGGLEDGVIQVWADHEDSVYTAEWSTADPWIFGSLSYDGRLVIGHVPRAVKFRILNLV